MPWRFHERGEEDDVVEAEHTKSRKRGSDGGWDKGMQSMLGEMSLLLTLAGPQDGNAWGPRFPPLVRHPHHLPQVAPEIELPMIDVNTHTVCIVFSFSYCLSGWIPNCILRFLLCMVYGCRYAAEGRPASPCTSGSDNTGHSMAATRLEETEKVIWNKWKVGSHLKIDNNNLPSQSGRRGLIYSSIRTYEEAGARLLTCSELYRQQEHRSKPWVQLGRATTGASNSNTPSSLASSQVLASSY